MIIYLSTLLMGGPCPYPEWGGGGEGMGGSDTLLRTHFSRVAHARIQRGGVLDTLLDTHFSWVALSRYRGGYRHPRGSWHTSENTFLLGGSCADPGGGGNTSENTLVLCGLYQARARGGPDTLLRTHLSWVAHVRIQRGVLTTPPPPLENLKANRFPQEYWSGPPEKPQNYSASVQCWAIIRPLVKCHVTIAHLKLYTGKLSELDPPSHQMKLSGSAHVSNAKLPNFFR